MRSKNPFTDDVRIHHKCADAAVQTIYLTTRLSRGTVFPEIKKIGPRYRVNTYHSLY